MGRSLVLACLILVGRGLTERRKGVGGGWDAGAVKEEVANDGGAGREDRRRPLVGSWEEGGLGEGGGMGWKGSVCVVAELIS